MRDDGRIECVSPWFPLVTFEARTLELLKLNDWGRIDEGTLTIRCVNGTARYRLGQPQLSGALPGRLLETL